MRVSQPYVIVALDFPDSAAALACAAQLDPAFCRVKVGKELFTAAGPHVVRELVARGFDVFLDLKFHDIPNTVAGAVSAGARLGAWMVNVHASGGKAMLQAARAAADAAERPPLLIAVTVLTSLGDGDLPAIGWQGTASSNAGRLATLAQECGVDGVVCSAHEAALVKQITRADFVTVTPGIRMVEDATGDQTRVMTPEKARANGADYLVIGRPVTQARDPRAKLMQISERLRAAEAAE